MTDHYYETYRDEETGLDVPVSYEYLKDNDLLKGFDGFIGFGTEDGTPTGDCCEDCICTDNCDQFEKLCEYCASINQFPSRIKEWHLFPASDTCFGEQDWKVSAYDERFGVTKSWFFRNLSTYTWNRTSTSSAYTQELWYNKFTKEYQTRYKSRDPEINWRDLTSQQPENLFYCGISQANYELDGGNDSADLYALPPYEFNFNYVTGETEFLNCTTPKTRWQGGATFSWRHGHSSAGGWIGSTGVATLLSTHHSEPPKVNCPTDEEL